MSVSQKLFKIILSVVQTVEKHVDHRDIYSKICLLSFIIFDNNNNDNLSLMHVILSKENPNFTTIS